MNHTNLKSLFKAIADAIRSKTGSTDTIVADDFPTAIEAIETGGGTDGTTSSALIDGSITEIEDDMVTKVRSYAFNTCRNLRRADFLKAIDIGAYAFSECSFLSYLNIPSVKYIGTGSFRACSLLTTVEFPPSLMQILGSAFYNCSGLTTVTFKGTPTSIASNIFQGCTNLATINVPWAEGEVANAPWGAPNATINYNYTA